MPLIGNAIPSMGDDLGDIIADVWDMSFATSLRVPYNSASQPSGARIARVGNVNNEGGVGADTFWRFQGTNQSTWYANAAQYSGTDRTRARSSMNIDLKANYFPWLAGFDPATLGISTGIPYWYNYRLEYSVGKGAATAGFLHAGWANGGGSLGDWTNPGSIGGLGMCLISLAGSTTWDGVQFRGDPSFAAPTPVLPLLVAGLDASGVHRLRFDVLSGPSFLMEFRIDDILVAQYDVSRFVNLSGVGFDDMSMRGQLTCGVAGVDGPYCSRATLRKVDS